MNNGNKKNGLIGLAIIVILSCVVIFGSEPLYEAISNQVNSKDNGNTNEQEVAAGNLKDGEYHIEDSDFDEKGYKDTMKMVVTDGKITELVWDNLDKEGKSKAALSLEGVYLMTESGLTWAAQAELLAAHVIEKESVNDLSMNEDGKIDTIAGVSISINGFVDQAEKLLAEAATKSIALAYRSGTYNVEGDYDDKGYKDVLKLVVADGKITEVSWDNLDKDGNSKSQLSLEGEYIMTEDGLTFAAQAEALANYVVEHQSISGLMMDEEGKIDSIAGVSIKINGFIEMCEKALAEASGVATGLLDGSYTIEDLDFDEKGYKDVVNLVVKNGAITTLTWDNLDKDGNSKAQLSMDGEYVMTEDGLTWAEQAKALADHVIDQQSMSGIWTDENGKIDSISGVSISINGFVDLTTKALHAAQATGEENGKTDTW